MHQNSSSTWLSRLVLICAAFHPSQTWAASLGPTVAETQVESDPAATALEVDVSELQDADDLTVRFVRTNVTKELIERYGVPIVEADDADAVLRVKLSYDDYENLTVRIRLEVVRRDRVQPLPDVICELCAGDPGIARKISEALPQAIPYLSKEKDPVIEAPSSIQVDEVPQVESQEPDPPRTKHAVAVGVWGGVGIGALILGGITTGVGIGYLVPKDDVGVDAANNAHQTRESTDPGGIALAAVGGGVMVLGAVSVMVDQLRLRPQRERTAKMSKPSVHFSPSVGTHQFGFTVRGRF